MLLNPGWRLGASEFSPWASARRRTECVVHQAALAALIDAVDGAVDELLLGQRDERAGGHEVGALDSSRCGEGPALSGSRLRQGGGHN